MKQASRSEESTEACDAFDVRRGSIIGGAVFSAIVDRLVSTGWIPLPSLRFVPSRGSNSCRQPRFVAHQRSRGQSC
jgi:hypothetical protein